MSSVLRFMIVVAFAAGANNASALPCAGFTDVDSTSHVLPERRVAEEPRGDDGLHLGDAVLPDGSGQPARRWRRS